MPALPIWRATVELAMPAYKAVPSTSVAPHHAVDRKAVPFVLDALITRNAKTLLELTKLVLMTALPAVVVAVPGTHSVWSVILFAPDKQLFTVLVLLSPDNVTFHPNVSLVVVFRVEVANINVPGVRVANWFVLIAKVSVCATVTDKLTAAA